MCTALSPAILGAIPALATLSALPEQLGHIFYFIVLPVLVMAGVGYLLQRTLRLDMPTLTRLNFYYVIPSIVYVSLVSARLHLGEAAVVVLFGVLMLLALIAVSWLAGRLRGVPASQRRVLMMTTIFYNSGNYGLPLQELAFRPSSLHPLDLSLQARTMQVFLMVVQNVANFTLGVLLAAGGRKDRHWRENLLHILKLPPLYALVAALLTVQIREGLGPSAGSVADALRPFWDAVSYVGNAMVAVAILTLGAQLGNVRRDANRYPVKLSVFLRLLGGPALGLGLIFALNFILGKYFGRPLTPFEAQVMLISTSTPTAVNCMLLCLEFDQHSDYAAQAVLYSTLLSPLTVTLVIFFAQGGFLPVLSG